MARLCLLFALLQASLLHSFVPIHSKPSYRSHHHLFSTLNDLNNSLKGLSNCRTATSAQRFLEKALLTDNNENKVLYKSISIPPGASSRGISDGDLAIQTRLVNRKYAIMDLIELSGDRDADRASLAVFGIMTASTLSALVANQNLPGPEIVRFLVVWIFSFLPLFFVGYGIADADQLQALLVLIQRNLLPAYRQRMIQHEAGHFLIGHLLGFPIQSYRANAVKNAVEFFPLADADRGKEYAQLLGFDRQSKSVDDSSYDLLSPAPDVPFFSKQGRGALLLEEQSVFRKEQNNSSTTRFSKLPSRNDPSTTWPFRGFDEATIDQLTVISVAGVCAEILAFGNAEGGLADLGQLRQIFSSVDNMSEREANNRIRYALGYCMSQLRRHLGALDALAAVMEREGSVEECVAAIESCKNPSGQDGILGDYEVRRREAFRSSNWIERIFLGSDDKTIDTIEDRMVEGKGGGYRKETFRLTGDDPLYAAIAVSVVFLLWASSGGLSLH